MARKHGHCVAAAGSGTPTYRAWQGMRNRCSNPDYEHYDRYGGRGIAVCQKWADSFEEFLADVGERPGGGYSLDRYPNNDGDYEPGNVRWATKAQQVRNRAVSQYVEHDGVKRHLKEWAEVLGIEYRTLWLRVKRWGVERAFKTPLRVTRPRR